MFVFGVFLGIVPNVIALVVRRGTNVQKFMERTKDDDRNKRSKSYLATLATRAC